MQNEDLPPSLIHEGEMMLAALVTDLSTIQTRVGEIMVSRDPRLVCPSLPATFISPAEEENIWDFWDRQMGEADALWPIAPETKGALERLCNMAEKKGIILLAGNPSAIHAAAGKRTTAEILSRGGVTVVPTYEVGKAIPPSSTGWVIKPDDGVGAEDTHHFRDLENMRRWLTSHPGYIVQPYVDGDVASLSILCRNGLASLLSCNRQRVAISGGEIRILALEVGGMEEHRGAFSRLSDAIASLLPGLWGYNGIDVVCSREGIVVLEINPRLTTSYVGLGESLDRNPAKLVLDLLEDGPLPPCHPRKVVTVDMAHE